MRLIHKIGSYQEDSSQFDIAHAIEHLAFKGTKNFPIGVDNSNLVHQLGMDNADITASSGRRQTEYIFNVPHGNFEGVEVGLLWFKDIINGLNLSEKDINSVRGEVKEEFLGKLGDNLQEVFATTKMYRSFFPCEDKEADFVAHYNNFASDDLKRFYTDWNNPGFFAVSVVGDIQDFDALEKRIKSSLSHLKPKELQKKPSNCDSLYYNRQPRFIIVKRKKDSAKFIEEKAARMHLFFPDSIIGGTLHKREGMERLLQFQIFLEILGQRFEQTNNRYGSEPTYLNNLYDRDMPPGMEIVHSFDDGTGENSFKELSRVLNQLRIHGISKEEFQKAKERHLKNLKGTNLDEDRFWFKQISKFYVQGEALPTDKLVYLTSYLENLNLTVLNEFVSSYLENGPKDIGIVAPGGHNALSFEEEEVRAWISKAYQEKIEPFELPEIPVLMGRDEISRLEEISYVDHGKGKSGSREIVLKNGVKLIFKSEYSSEPENGYPIHLHGFSLGGAKDLPEKDYYSAVNASAIIQNAGVNNLNRFELDRFLASAGLMRGAVSPYIDYAEHGIYGRSDLDDLETMMQMVYLYCTSPNRNEMAYEDWKNRKFKTYINPNTNLMVTDFDEAVRSLTGDKSLVSMLGRKAAPGGTRGYKSVAETDFDRAYSIYRNFFGNASGMVFLITGDFEIGQILPLAQKYLGNLPSFKRKKIPLKSSELVELPKGPSFQMFLNEGNYKMENISYGTRFIQPALKLGDWQEQIKVAVLGEVVEQKLWHLRYKKGYGLYNVSARGRYNEELKRYEIGTYLYCQPKDFTEIQKEIKQIYSEMKSGSISSKELDPALEMVYYFNFSERAKRTGSLINELYKHYRYEQPWVASQTKQRFLKSLTSTDIMEVARKFLKSENFHEFVIRDER
ncbi:insulinase family protein [Salinimicrobium sp. MT39]|uniref:Insulinase family protein n=1 Tax=Salinimicrobium profundisediminis TaxID=2994553 RepID=A0A9X3I1Z6_9FLAO|nr:insulinase family protein [Salinimicrobium profundisediminis]MCX2839104.1 insulinase family protein [Salinimicrobium profundisediminis]